MNLAAGGAGATDFGHPANLALAVLWLRSALVPESVQYFPPAVEAMLETGIIQAAFLAIVLNLVLPDPEAKR